MATASYPTALKTYTDKVDNVDYVKAADVNSLQAEVAAIENTLGINAGTSLLPSSAGTYSPSGGATTLANRVKNLEAFAANSQVPGANKLLNGDFSIWQRGTSFSVTANNTYTADRWLNVFTGGTTGTKTISQQTFTPGSAPVTGYESAYFLRVNQTVAGSGQTAHGLTQRIEDVRSFAGQTVTFSFYAKAAAAFTRQISFTQFFGTGGSSTLNDVVTAPFTVGTTWARYSFTVDIPSIAGKTIGTDSFLEAVIGLPLNSTFTLDVWGVQVEVGSVATRFNTATGNPASELAACQRYFERFSSNSQIFGNGVNKTTSSAYITTVFKVTKRKIPTITSVLTSNTMQLSDHLGVQRTVTSLTAPNVGDYSMLLLPVIGSASLSLGFGSHILCNSLADYVDASAEL